MYLFLLCIAGGLFFVSFFFFFFSFVNFWRLIGLGLGHILCCLGVGMGVGLKVTQGTAQ